MTLLELQDVLGKTIVSIEDGTGSIDKAKAIASLAKQMINNADVMNMLDYRENHKLDEWREFCEILRGLPYIKEIRGENK